MKTRRTFFRPFVLLFMAIALTTSCKKGEMGIQGDKGEQGVAGPEGSTILSGGSAPSITLGNNGDFYLDLSASNLYGPKTVNGWGSPLSLKGTTGNAGANGKSILSGTGIPGTSLGMDGDYYLDKITYNFYGPKTGGNWGTPTALIGPQGPMGNANIKIDIFTVKTSDWQNGGNITFELLPGMGGGTGFPTKYFDRGAAALTSEFLSGSGIVSVYYQSQSSYNSNSWLPLPFSVVNQYTGLGYNWLYETNINNVRLHFSLVGYKTPVGDFSAYQVAEAKYKIVIATGTVMSGLAAAKIDRNDKQAVAKYLGLIANSGN